jgi:hypothetical protein
MSEVCGARLGVQRGRRRQRVLRRDFGAAGGAAEAGQVAQRRGRLRSVEAFEGPRVLLPQRRDRAPRPPRHSARVPSPHPALLARRHPIQRGQADARGTGGQSQREPGMRDYAPGGDGAGATWPNTSVRSAPTPARFQ